MWVANIWSANEVMVISAVSHEVLLCTFVCMLAEFCHFEVKPQGVGHVLGMLASCQ